MLHHLEAESMGGHLCVCIAPVLTLASNYPNSDLNVGCVPSSLLSLGSFSFLHVTSEAIPCSEWSSQNAILKQK